MQVELWQLELTFAALRICGSGPQSRLMAQLAEVGQQSPVVVVASTDSERYVLIDGYRRVEALHKLGRDTVDAIVLPLPLPEALVWHRRQEATRRRTAIEDGWLLRELCEGHGLSGADVARRLGRSDSWVSRRLALVRALPQRVQDLVRSGALSAQATMKYLVPLARGKAEDCERLAENLAGERISVRQMHKLYVAWRQSDGETRQRLCDHPMLFLSASAAAQPPAEGNAEVLSDLHALEGICRRLAHKLRQDGGDKPYGRAVHDAWRAAQQSFDALFEWLRC